MLSIGVCCCCFCKYGPCPREEHFILMINILNSSMCVCVFCIGSDGIP